MKLDLIEINRLSPPGLWVLQCQNRIAFVRRIIGASAIRYWRTNRLLDYALTQYFGDWKRKFPDGFTNSDTKSKRQGAPKFRQQKHTYKWKLFALVKTVNVQAFLYRKRAPNAAENAEEQEMRDAYYKLWGVAPGDDKILRKWTQPRGARILKPIRFMPYELKLEPEKAAETLPSIVIPQDAPKRIEGDVEPKLKPGEPLPKKPP